MSNRHRREREAARAAEAHNARQRQLRAEAAAPPPYVPQPGDLATRGLGVQMHVPGELIAARGRRLDELVARAERVGEHLWTMNVCHLVSDIDQAVRGEMLADIENLLYAGLGCYVCEQPFTPELRHRRCPGQPKGS